jgi:RsiW-degrading membrane proteinase PrsW (M82 family)
MIYLENIFVCLVGPLIIAVLVTKGRYRMMFLFFAIGMGMCLLAAYINTFFAQLYNADPLSAAVEIAPVCEEILKLLPVLFLVLIFEPNIQDARVAIICVSAGFATFENTYYLIQNYSANLSHLLIRGFGVGAMHIVCGAIVGYGMFYIWRHTWLKLAGTLGLLCAAITYHAIYNLTVSVDYGVIQYIGYLFPILSILAGIPLEKRLDRINH